MLRIKNEPAPHQHYEGVLRNIHKTHRKVAMPVINSTTQVLQFIKQMYFKGDTVHVTDTLGYPADRDFIEDSLTMFGDCRLIVWQKRSRQLGHVRQQN